MTEPAPTPKCRHCAAAHGNHNGAARLCPDSSGRGYEPREQPPLALVDRPAARARKYDQPTRASTSFNRDELAAAAISYAAPAPCPSFVCSRAARRWSRSSERS